MKALKNPKLRTLLLLSGVIAVVVIAIAVLQSDGAVDPNTSKNSRTMAVPSGLKAVPGNDSPEKYRELQIIDNQNRVVEAKKSDQSAIPTIVRTTDIDEDLVSAGLTSPCPGKEIIHGKGNMGTYGVCPDGRAFGIGPDGKPYTTGGWETHGFGPYGPYGIGPDGKPFGIGPDGQPYDPNGPYGPGGPLHKPDNAGYEIHGYGPYGPYGVGPDGKPFGIGPDGQPYDPKGPFAPPWYTPKEKNADDPLARLQAQSDELEQRRQERLAQMKAEEDARRAAAERARLAQQNQQAAVERAAVNEKQVKIRQQSMEGFSQALLGKWAAVTPQAYVQGTRPLYSQNDPLSQSAAAQVLQAQDIDPEQLLAAGTILFAVVDTAVNSEQPGPILATLVSGEHRGARLIGTFEPPSSHGTDGVSINFTSMSLPGALRAIGIDAIALHPDTARTVLASDIDRHYLYRYGSLFASSFLAGYGKVIETAGATTTTNTDSSTTSNSKDLSGKEELFAALGNVGNAWAASMGENFNVLPTVTINPGTSIGLLFMADVDLSTAYNEKPPEAQGNAAGSSGAASSPAASSSTPSRSNTPAPSSGSASKGNSTSYAGMAGAAHDTMSLVSKTSS